MRRYKVARDMGEITGHLGGRLARVDQAAGVLDLAVGEPFPAPAQVPARSPALVSDAPCGAGQAVLLMGPLFILEERHFDQRAPCCSRFPSLAAAMESRGAFRRRGCSGPTATTKRRQSVWAKTQVCSSDLPLATASTHSSASRLSATFRNV
jgi:hypothetical protein